MVVVALMYRIKFHCYFNAVVAAIINADAIVVPFFVLTSGSVPHVIRIR